MILNVSQVCVCLCSRNPQAYGRSPERSPYVSFKKASNSLEYRMPRATISGAMGSVKLLPVSKSLHRMRRTFNITLCSLIGKSVIWTAFMNPLESKLTLSDKDLFISSSRPIWNAEPVSLMETILKYSNIWDGKTILAKVCNMFSSIMQSSTL